MFVSARLAGATWQVRAAGTDAPVDLEVTPRVSGSTVAYDLPGQINTEGAIIDLGKPAKVRATSNVRLHQRDGGAHVFTDACTGSDNPDDEIDW